MYVVTVSSRIPLLTARIIEDKINVFVRRVAEALASMSREYIYFPRNEAEIAEAQLQFYRIARFPQVIGALDCTHVKIINPGMK